VITPPPIDRTFRYAPLFKSNFKSTLHPKVNLHKRKNISMSEVCILAIML
jgi:hypothetical protein